MTPQMRRRINERWDEIAPTLLLQAKRNTEHCQPLMDCWRAIHSQRVELLLARGVRLRKIRLHSWDDPRLSVEQFIAIIERAVTNRRKRNRTIPPHGLAKFKYSDVPSKGDTHEPH